MREDGGDGEAAGALDVHEERAGCGHEGLELVLLGLTASTISIHACDEEPESGSVRGRGGVEKINCEHLAMIISSIRQF